MNPTKLIALAGMALALTGIGHAFPVLTISSGGDSVSDDNGVFTVLSGTATTLGDTGLLGANSGYINWQGSIDGWTFAAGTGTTDPATAGSATDPIMDLQFGYSSVGAAPLTISWTDEFGPLTAGNDNTGIGGTISGNTALQYSVFENGSQISPTLTYTGAGTFALTGVAGIVADSATDATIEQVITLTGGGVGGGGSGDAQLFGVPDSGMTAVLVALGIGAVGLFAGYRNRKSRVLA
jgi:hypothetical protein